MPELLAVPRERRAAPKPPRAAVAGLGVSLPKRVVTTDSIAERLGVERDWIVSRTGIEERRLVAPAERLTDLAGAAAAAALADAQLPAEEIDLVLVATCSPDELVAPAAPQVARAIGADGAGAIDVGAACSGFVSGLALAAGAIESGRAGRVLLVGAEVLSRLTDTADRKTAGLFGDGAGAVVMAAAGDGGGELGPVVLGHDGSGSGLLFASRARGVIEMDGHEVFRHAVERMAEAAEQAATAAGLGLEDIDQFVFHQANARIVRALARRLALAPERVVDVIARHGNTSAASIPLALAQARADGRLRRGTRVLVAAFGAGFTWGGAVLTW